MVLKKINTMINTRRSKLVVLIAGIFIAAISCFFICPLGSFIHDTLPYILGILGWAVLFIVFIIDKRNGGENFEPYDPEHDV